MHQSHLQQYCSIMPDSINPFSMRTNIGCLSYAPTLPALRILTSCFGGVSTLFARVNETCKDPISGRGQQQQQLTEQFGRELTSARGPKSAMLVLSVLAMLTLTLSRGSMMSLNTISCAELRSMQNTVWIHIRTQGLQDKYSTEQLLQVYLALHSYFLPSDWVAKLISVICVFDRCKVLLACQENELLVVCSHYLAGLYPLDPVTVSQREKTSQQADHMA